MRIRKRLTRLRESLHGLSGEHIALILTIGLVLGTFPVFGLPTVLCLAASLSLRVSLPALQLVNQLSSPLQLLLLFPLQRVGSSLFSLPFKAPHAVHLAFNAVAGWFCICVPVGCVLYLSLLCLLRRRRAL